MFRAGTDRAAGPAAHGAASRRESIRTAKRRTNGHFGRQLHRGGTAKHHPCMPARRALLHF